MEREMNLERLRRIKVHLLLRASKGGARVKVGSNSSW